jgi:hypothetical protein
VGAGALRAVAASVAAPGTAGLLAQLAAATLAGGAAYLLLCRALRVSELQVAWVMLTRRGTPLGEPARRGSAR